ncbi:hypothetical protein ACFX13_005218 [Malus domestica]
MILVYELAPNRSLDYAFDPVNHLNLDWDMHYNVIVCARGLLYLHEDSPLPIVHGDRKASNILIYAEMNPKISDVGMSKLHGIHKRQGGTERFQSIAAVITKTSYRTVINLNLINAMLCQ